MSTVTWKRPMTGGPDMVSTGIAGEVQPQLLVPGTEVARRQILDLQPGFTREWSATAPDDAGLALAGVFADQIQEAVTRVNAMPIKSRAEFLIATGQRSAPPKVAATIVQFSASDEVSQPIFAGKRFQISGPAADSSGDDVVFETLSDVYVTPGSVESSFTDTGGFMTSVDLVAGVDDPAATPVEPFGGKPEAGNALLVGISGEVVAPSQKLSLAVQISVPTGMPPAVSRGGAAPLSTPPPPKLVWEILDGGRFVPVELILDETLSLTQSGAIELRLPSRWRPGTPAGIAAPDGTPFRWFRTRLFSGEYESAPRILWLAINAVRAVAETTIRDEVLLPVPGSKRRRMQLTQRPVISDSVRLRVDEGGSGDASSLWREVSALTEASADERVYVLDVATGEVTFGDGRNGRETPPGFRNIVADQYRVGGGSAGNLKAGEINKLVTSIPLLNEVRNLTDAVGGSDEEGELDTLLRAPAELRSRGRAVTPADFELLALRAPGADVTRACAIPGQHPGFPGNPIAGVVGLFVTSSARENGPPVADQQSLAAVAVHLQNVAQAGIEVVVAPPVFHTIQVRMAAEIDSAANQSVIVRQILDELDRYFSPLVGGDTGRGWPFGRAVEYAAVLRRLMARISDLRGIPFLTISLDGVRHGACRDVPIRANGLLWPASHEVFPESGDG